MIQHICRALSLIILGIGFTFTALAQDTLTQLQAQLVSPWLVTVEGEARLRSFRILSVGQKTPDTFLIEATYGWIDGNQVPVRAEISQLSNQQRLQIMTPAASTIVATQAPDGSFAGTFTTKGGAAKPVKLEKLSEQVMQSRAQAALSAKGSQVFADEDTDWGIEPTSRARTSQFHAPTPRTIPGAQVIKTLELKLLLDTEKTVVVIDVLDSKDRITIPGAFWMPGAGSGQLFGAEKGRFSTALEKLTGGNKQRPIVFLCLSSECWLSYNASLHALEAGYKNVSWYRGGTESWRAAKFPRKVPEQVNW